MSQSPSLATSVRPSNAITTSAEATTLDLDFSDHLIDVIAEGVDAVIRSGVLPDSQLTSWPFEALIAAPVCPRNGLSARTALAARLPIRAGVQCDFILPSVTPR